MNEEKWGRYNIKHFIHSFPNDKEIDVSKIADNFKDAMKLEIDKYNPDLKINTEDAKKVKLQSKISKLGFSFKVAYEAKVLLFTSCYLVEGGLKDDKGNPQLAERFYNLAHLQEQEEYLIQEHIIISAFNTVIENITNEAEKRRELSEKIKDVKPVRIVVDKDKIEKNKKSKDVKTVRINVSKTK